MLNTLISQGLNGSQPLATLSAKLFETTARPPRDFRRCCISPDHSNRSFKKARVSRAQLACSRLWVTQARKAAASASPAGIAAADVRIARIAPSEGTSY